MTPDIKIEAASNEKLNEYAVKMDLDFTKPHDFALGWRLSHEFTRSEYDEKIKALEERVKELEGFAGYMAGKPFAELRRLYERYLIEKAEQSITT